MFDGKLNLRSKSSDDEPSFDTSVRSDKKKLPAAGSVLRDRGRRRSSEIEDIWGGQSKGAFLDDKDELISVSKAAGKVHEINKDIAKNVHTKLKNIKNDKNITNRVNKKYAAVGIGLVVIMIIGAQLISNISTQKVENTDVQGTSTAGQNSQSNGSLAQTPLKEVTESELEFDLLFPLLQLSDERDIVRISPPENEPVYAFNDNYEGALLKISQQEIPNNIKDDINDGVKKIANDFQATDTIVINGRNVYHGYSEKNGGVQSLIFEKSGLLVFIASSERLSDEAWVGYVSSMQ